MSWMDNAACQNSPDPKADWFGDKRSDGYNRAVSICLHVCPVRAECLDWALTVEEEHGIWGGKNPDERNAMRRARRQEMLLVDLV